MLSEQAEDAFASVATALLRAGVRSVVAMGYSLYVEGARQFLPAFYQELFRTGNVSQAVRSGRQAMFKQPERVGLPLQDWLVPVLYQQDALDLKFATNKQAQFRTLPKVISIPPEACVEAIHAPHGVIGRDSAVLALERASRRAPAAMLLHGLGGIGKTTLVRGYIEWLVHTQGLPQRVIWQSLVDVRSFDYLRNRLVVELFGTDAMAQLDVEKWPALVQSLCDNAVLVVWDNFESISGSVGGGTSEVLAAMPAQDRQALRRFLEQLRGGRSKVLITSRSDEQWLGPTLYFPVALGGLQGDERRELARAILADHGARLDPRDEDTASLINSLMGHPLMMRAILPKLASMPAAKLLVELDQYQPQAATNDPVEQRLYATMRYVEKGLPEALRPLLIPIGMHEEFVEADCLVAIARESGQFFSPVQVSQALVLLEAAGLMRGMGNDVYEMHPALGRHLRTQVAQQPVDRDTQQAWERGFCKVMGKLADNLAAKQLHVQRPAFKLFGGSFERALLLSKAKGEWDEVGALLQTLAAYALNIRNLPLAAQRFETLAITCERMERKELAAGAYHQLGVVAQGRRDFDAAERWYRKALAVFDQIGDEDGASRIHHQLGNLSLFRHDFDGAERWYRKALAVIERNGNEQDTATTYHQLGAVDHERRDFDGAERWYRKALSVFERHKNENVAAGTYHQLGLVAEERRDFDGAECWYRKALVIFERLGNESDAASTYHQLGVMAQKQGDVDTAERWYSKAVTIYERQGNEHGAAVSYQQLGRLAEIQRDFDVSENWYRKSMVIKERHGNEHGASISYYHLGRVAEERGNFDVAESWYLKSLTIEERQGNEHGAAISYNQLGNLALKRRDFDTAETWYLKALNSNERRRNKYYAAGNYHQLGMLAEQRRDFDAAEGWYGKALAVCEQLGELSDTEALRRSLMRLKGARD
jgi:tetratricopeptide (TPR) repeat protein